MPVFEAVVLVTPLTNDFDELCLLALLHRTSVLGFALGFFPAVPVEVGGDTGVRRSTLGSGDRSVTQGTHRNLGILGVLEGTGMGVVQEVVVAELGFAGVTFDWQEIQLVAVADAAVDSKLRELHRWVNCRRSGD